MVPDRGAAWPGQVVVGGQAQAASVALLPLRLHKTDAPFGLLVLASPDAQRFHSGMGTDFLEHLAELCSAALSALLPAKG